MTLLVPLLIAAVLACLLCEAFFSGTETALISADRAQLRASARRGDARAALAERLLERAEALLSTTLVGTNLAVVTATALATVVVGHYVAPSRENLVTTLVLSPLILVFGEIVPKSIGRAYADRATRRLAGPLRLIQRALSPIVQGASRLAEAALAVLGSRATGQSPYVTREELMAMAELGERHGLLVSDERRMIHSILELRERPVSTVMVPLVDVAAIPLGASVADLEELAAHTGFSRFPVYEARVDNVVGMVSTLDVLHAVPEAGRGTARLAPFVRRDVTYVPETKAVGDLLQELRTGPMPTAVVVDERGGVVGLVTTDDLVEEIVGRIRDVRHDGPGDAVATSRAAFECDGRMEIDELIERTGEPIAKEGFETVAGLVVKVAGRIPQAGDEIELGPFRIEVLEADARRIARLRVVRIHPNRTDSEGG